MAVKRNKEDLIIALLVILVVLQVYGLATREQGVPTLVTTTTSANNTGSLLPSPAGPSTGLPKSQGVNPPTPPPRIGVLYFDDYLKGIVLLEQQPDLALSKDQARQLLGPVKDLAAVYGAVPEAQTMLSRILTQPQVSFIQTHRKDSKVTPPPYRMPVEPMAGPLAGQVLQLLERKTR